MKNLISWVEIPAVDFERAVNFYKSVLGTDLQVFDCETEKMACFPSGEGAIFKAEGYKPSTDGVIVSLNTEDDLEGTIQRVQQNGGKILIPKTKIEVEGRGYFSIFIDSEGNKLGLYGN
ncbi:MAG TPA: VOC family protein [Lentimicrobium sp.]|nr:VOC family protein [Lentimicrobium sp.]